MTYLEQLAEEIKFQLQHHLPGQLAQYEMTGIYRKIQPPDLSKITGYRRSSVCLMLFEQAGEIYFPIIQRPDYDGVHSGQLALPGGKFEEEDIRAERTALREMEEETGYSASSVEIIGKLTDLYIPHSNYLVHPYIAYTKEFPQFLPDQTEVKELILYKMSNLLNEELVKETEMNLQGRSMRIPYFDVEGRVLWGATAMMLSEFKHVLRNISTSSFQFR